jgi:uncharacterized protein YkwD
MPVAFAIEMFGVPSSASTFGPRTPANSALRRLFSVLGPRCCVAVLSLLVGCAPRAQDPATAPALQQEPRSAVPGRDPGSPSSIIADSTAVDFADDTASPRWDTAQRLSLPACQGYERPLALVARAVAETVGRRGGATELADVTVLLRALGSPHVWPRVWLMEGRPLAEDELMSAWTGWLGREPGLGERRCGTARVRAADGREIVAVVVVDVLADLDPLPLRARTGQWLRLDARPIAAVREARLLLLGPDGGSPRSVPGRLEPGAFHAAFSLDGAGLWRLQLLLDAGGGPRPALEAWVFADEAPDLAAALRPAPGEEQGPPPSAGRDELRAALSYMIDAGRRSQGLQPLRRDWALDDLAQHHAEAMLSRGQTAHDVGQGLPTERVARAGVRARRVGENVARARSIERAHRALWDSPSHRGNMLDPGFVALGIGVARAEPDDVWVCELFTDAGAGTPAAASPSPAAASPASRSASRAP